MGAGANIENGKHKKVLWSVRYVLKGKYYSQLSFPQDTLLFLSVDRLLVAGRVVLTEIDNTKVSL